jgi:UDP-N-acetyl-2-amino-2-deoxyglucuronate dehydrogenase
MKNIINVAIIGCGRVAGHHVRAIDNHPQLNLVAVCDLQQDRISNMLGMKTIPNYTNYHRMMVSHPEIDVVAIITPSGMHFEHAFDMIDIYKKHVVIEKPVVMTLQQGNQIAKAAANAGVHIFPVHQYRFNRCVQRIRQAIMNQELGKVQLATVRMRWCRQQSYYDRDAWRGTFALDGGCTTNQGIHHLDLLRYLNGEIKMVNCMMRTFGSNVEVEDTVIANLEFENGALGNIEIITSARPRDFESSLSIVGSKGLAMLGGSFTDKLLEFSPVPQDVIIYSDDFDDAYGFGHNVIYDGVYKGITDIGSPAISFSDAMNTMKFLHAMYVSSENGTWVNVQDGLSSKRLGSANEKLHNLYRTFRV